MTVVLDATAIIAMVTRESALDAHVAKATRIMAPDLAVAETLNVRWKYRHADLTPPDLDSLLALFDRITIVPSRAYAAEADAFSIRFDHPAYDCLYAAVARRENARLLTGDRRFAKKLRSSNIDVVTFG